MDNIGKSLENLVYQKTGKYKGEYPDLLEEPQEKDSGRTRVEEIMNIRSIIYGTKEVGSLQKLDHINKLDIAEIKQTDSEEKARALKRTAKANNLSFYSRHWSLLSERLDRLSTGVKGAVYGMVAPVTSILLTNSAIGGILLGIGSKKHLEKKASKKRYNPESVLRTISQDLGLKEEQIKHNSESLLHYVSQKIDKSGSRLNIIAYVYFIERLVKEKRISGNTKTIKHLIEFNQIIRHKMVDQLADIYQYRQENDRPHQDGLWLYRDSQKDQLIVKAHPRIMGVLNRKVDKLFHSLNQDARRDFRSGFRIGMLAGAMFDLSRRPNQEAWGQLGAVKIISLLTLADNTLVNNRYTVRKTLGSGGMSTVYLVNDNKLTNKQWALKELDLSAFKISSRDKQDMLNMFKREAQTLSTLKHSQLPHIADSFEENNKYYLVMEYFEGTDLEKLREKNKFDDKEITRIGIEVCKILEYLHQQKPPIVYRDIKPSNIMMTTDGTVKLIDFGIARMAYEKVQQTRIGTPDYAPFEQYQGCAEPRSDLFALARTLYFLHYGCTPNDIPKQQISMICPELKNVIDKAGQHLPNNRFDSAKQMRLALESIINNNEMSISFDIERDVQDRLTEIKIIKNLNKSAGDRDNYDKLVNYYNIGKYGHVYEATDRLLGSYSRVSGPSKEWRLIRYDLFAIRGLLELKTDHLDKATESFSSMIDWWPENDSGYKYLKYTEDLIKKGKIGKSKDLLKKINSEIREREQELQKLSLGIANYNNLDDLNQKISQKQTELNQLIGKIEDASSWSDLEKKLNEKKLQLEQANNMYEEINEKIEDAQKDYEKIILETKKTRAWHWLSKIFGKKGGLKE